jgi:hypothetical protein
MNASAVKSDNTRAHEIIFDAVKLLEELAEIADRNEEEVLESESPKKLAIKNNVALKIYAETALDATRSAKFCCAYLKQ